MGGDPGQGFCDGLVELFGVACFGGAKELFEFSPGFLDGVEVGRVRRQVQHVGATLLKPFSHPGYLVRAEIIHDHNVARTQLRAEHLVEVGEEDVGIGGRLDGHGCDHAAEAHGPKNGQDLPVTAGRGFVDALAFSRTAIESRHAGRNAAFVKKDQLFGRDRADPVEEFDPPLEVDRGIAFDGVERLFFLGSPSRVSVSQTSDRLNRTPA